MGPRVRLVLPAIPILLGLAVVGFRGSAAVQAAGECIEGGGGHLRLSLSGYIQHSIDWENSGTNCNGRGGSGGMELTFERIIHWGDAVWGGGSVDGANLQLTFHIGIAVGETGQGKASIRLSGHSLDGSFTTPADACSIRVTENSSLGGGRYRVEGSGWCSQPAVALIGSDETIHISEFAFAGPVYRVQD